MSKSNLSKCLLAMSLAMTVATPARADSTIKVSLWDKGGMMDMSKSMMMGMGLHANMKMAIMGVDIDQKSVAAGKITFEVTNNSKETIHEMLVAPIADENVVLPFIANENRVDEEAAHDLGEVSELDPAKSGALTLDLKPGNYILYCNVPGHFMAGMWTVLNVK